MNKTSLNKPLQNSVANWNIGTESFLRKTIYWLIPPACYNCGKVLLTHQDGYPFLCTNCYTNLPWNARTKISLEGLAKDGSQIDIHFVFSYEKPLSSWIWALKFYRQTTYARFLGTLWANNLIMNNFFSQHRQYALVPVPLSAQRLRWRGYNHTYLLAYWLAKYLCNFGINVELWPKVLLKNHDTSTQISLNRSDRIKNISDAFSINTNALELTKPVDNLRIFIVDDLLTTGSTIMNCAKALEQVSTAEISALALAYVELDA